MPLSCTFHRAPVKGGSVPCSRKTWKVSPGRRCFHSVSERTTLPTVSAAAAAKGSSGFVFLADDPGETAKRSAAQALQAASHATLGMRITANPSFLLAVRFERILSPGRPLGARRGAASLLPNHEQEPIHNESHAYEVRDDP